MGDTTPIGAVGKGLVAGAIGTGAMTAYQMAVAKARDSGSSTVPAEVGKRVVRGVFQRRVSEERTDQINQAMHWGYGTSWGALYGIAEASVDRSPVRHGLVLGALVWGASLIELPAMKLAPPVWEYPPAELALDVSFHLVYGISVAIAFRALRA